MFKDITIKARLIAVLSLLCMLLVVIGGLGLWGMSRGNHDLRQMYERELAQTAQVANMLELLMENRALMFDAINEPTTDTIRNNAALIEQNRATVDRLWQAYMDNDHSARGLEIAERFSAARRHYVQDGLIATMDLLRNGNIERAIDVAYEVGVPAFVPVREIARELMQMQVATAQHSFEAAATRYGVIRGVVIGALLFGILLASAVGVLLIRAIVMPLNEAVRLAGAIASGDLTQTVDVHSNDETGTLLLAMQQMNDQLAELVLEITEASTSVATGSREIASGNANLSQRTEEQASSLEETASSMEELTSTVRQTADNAGQANQLANAAREAAEKGGDVVARTVDAMSEINRSSKKVADIIGVIDEIAFQTNLLALNAAVEAARAGEQGRGFAVVAAEVRNLAQRSASSAKEIKDLIGDSVQKVDDGADLVEQSGKTLDEIVTRVKKVTDIVAEIAAASQEQSSGIDQVNTAVMQLDELTQQNAALVEEASAASQSMADQARVLNELIGRYRINERVSQRAHTQVRQSAFTAPAVESAPVGPPGGIERRSASRPWAGTRKAAKTTPATASQRLSATGTDDADWEEF